LLLQLDADIVLYCYNVGVKVWYIFQNSNYLATNVSDLRFLFDKDK